MVVLWSKEAAQSEWVRAEADFARAERKLVQAQVDETLPPLPFIEAMNLPPREFFDMGPPTFSASRIYVLSGRGKRLAELYRAAISSPESLTALYWRRSSHSP